MWPLEHTTMKATEPHLCLSDRNLTGPDGYLQKKAEKIQIGLSDRNLTWPLGLE